MTDAELNLAKLELEKQRSDNESARLELDRARLKLDDYKANLDHFRATIEANKPMIEGLFRFAEMAVRSLLVLNGGSALAVLTFTGHTYNAGSKAKLSVFGELISIYGLGAAAAVATAALAYLAQMFILELKSARGKWWFGGGFRAVAILSAFLSFAAFCFGVWKASAIFAS